MVRRVASLAVVLITLIFVPACSVWDLELNNRGGFIDAKLDSKFMIADTKQMRVLRAYLLIGSIARLSREQYYRSEREIIIQHINSAILVANDAFACAYANPGDCVYFDERMAEFEVALLRLAIAVFTKNENESLFEVLGKNLSESSPLLKSLDIATKTAEAATATADLTAQVGKVLTSILKLGGAAYVTGRRLGALYRDAIELDMVAVLGSLQYYCNWKQGRVTGEVRTGSPLEISQTAFRFYGAMPSSGDPCATYSKGHAIWARGAGALSEWHDFLANDAAIFRKYIIPGDVAFMQASDLIWRACEQITDRLDLISACLGARAKQYECGCVWDSKNQDNKFGDCSLLADARNANAIRGEAKKTLAMNEKRASEDSCPLIAFYETWSARRDRFSRASTRLDWLSISRSRVIRMSEEVVRPQSPAAWRPQ